MNAPAPRLDPFERAGCPNNGASFNLDAVKAEMRGKREAAEAAAKGPGC